MSRGRHAAEAAIRSSNSDSQSEGLRDTRRPPPGHVGASVFLLLIIGCGLIVGCAIAAVVLATPQFIVLPT